MGLKKCEKCGENVDEAKAFCPECGNPFVEEQKREASSEFDEYAGTIKYTKSVYKMMLSEMELDTSKKPEKESKPNQRQEVKEIIPPKEEPSGNEPPKEEPPKEEPLKEEPLKEEPLKIDKSKNESPPVDLPQNVQPRNDPANDNKKPGINKWIILGVIGLLIPMFLAITILVVLYIYIF